MGIQNGAALLSEALPLGLYNRRAAACHLYVDGEYFRYKGVLPTARDEHHIADVGFLFLQRRIDRILQHLHLPTRSPVTVFMDGARVEGKKSRTAGQTLFNAAYVRLFFGKMCADAGMTVMWLEQGEAELQMYLARDRQCPLNVFLTNDSDMLAICYAHTPTEAASASAVATAMATEHWSDPGGGSGDGCGESIVVADQNQTYPAAVAPSVRDSCVWAKVESGPIVLLGFDRLADRFGFDPVPFRAMAYACGTDYSNALLTNSMVQRIMLLRRFAVADMATPGWEEKSRHAADLKALNEIVPLRYRTSLSEHAATAATAATAPATAATPAEDGLVAPAPAAAPAAADDDNTDDAAAGGPLWQLVHLLAMLYYIGCRPDDTLPSRPGRCRLATVPAQRTTEAPFDPDRLRRLMIAYLRYLEQGWRDPEVDGLAPIDMGVMTCDLRHRLPHLAVYGTVQKALAVFRAAFRPPYWTWRDTDQLVELRRLAKRSASAGHLKLTTLAVVRPDGPPWRPVPILPRPIRYDEDGNDTGNPPAPPSPPPPPPKITKPWRRIKPVRPDDADSDGGTGNGTGGNGDGGNGDSGDNKGARKSIPPTRPRITVRPRPIRYEEEEEEEDEDDDADTDAGSGDGIPPTPTSAGRPASIPPTRHRRRKGRPCHIGDLVGLGSAVKRRRLMAQNRLQQRRKEQEQQNEQAQRNEHAQQQPSAAIATPESTTSATVAATADLAAEIASFGQPYFKFEDEK